MKARYDKDADAMYLKFRDAEVASTKKLDKNTIADFDVDGKLIGLEFLYVSKERAEMLAELRAHKMLTA